MFVSFVRSNERTNARNDLRPRRLGDTTNITPQRTAMAVATMMAEVATVAFAAMATAPRHLTAYSNEGAAVSTSILQSSPIRHFKRWGYGKGGSALTRQRPSASNMAPIGAKLCQNAFQTIPVKSMFGPPQKNRRDFSESKIVLHLLGAILEDLRRNGLIRRIPRNFSL